MMKKRFLSKALMSLSIAGGLITPAVIAASCSQEKISKIKLYLERTDVRPGETVIIRAIVEPSYRRTQNLNWSLENAPDGVTISSRGAVSVPLDLQIAIPKVIKIVATAPNDKNVTTTANLTILPKPSLDFQGFVGSQVQHLDRAHRLVNTEIDSDGEYAYVTRRNIDLFVMDNHYDAPKYFTSFIYFQPMISSSVTQYMSFSIKGGPDRPHGIMWKGYVDGSWTNTIPDFIISNPAFYFETLIVRFSCDPRITLTINFNIWQNIDQHNTGIISYIPDQQDDPHSITEGVSGKYEMNMLCPDKIVTGKYSGHIGSLYCNRPPQEYTEFNIGSFKYDKKLDPILKDALTVSVSKPEIIIRPYDHMRFYKFSLDYTFDLDKKQYDASHWHYQSLALGSITIVDPMFTESVPCWIEFFIQWKN